MKRKKSVEPKLPINSEPQKRKTKEKKLSNETVIDETSEKVADVSKTKKAKKPPKEVKLRQWLVCAVQGNKKIFQFVLATCGKTARATFQQKYKGSEIWLVLYSAETEKTTRWLENNSPFQSVEIKNR